MKPAWMRKELPGFLGNYIYGGISSRAKYVVQNGYCTAQEVDTALEILRANGEDAYIIGETVKSEESVILC